jgi:hypothetical protein
MDEYYQLYDSGALMAIDSHANKLSADRHRDRVNRGRKVLVPTVVAAQVIRKPATQAGLGRARRLSAPTLTTLVTC